MGGGSIDSDTDAMAGDMCVRCLLPVHGMQVQALNARGRKRRASWLGVGVALSFYCARRGGRLRNGEEGGNLNTQRRGRTELGGPRLIWLAQYPIFHLFRLGNA